MCNNWLTHSVHWLQSNDITAAFQLEIVAEQFVTGIFIKMMTITSMQETKLAFKVNYLKDTKIVLTWILTEFATTYLLKGSLILNSDVSLIFFYL